MKNIFRKYKYSTSLIDLCIKGFLINFYISKVIVQNVPKTDGFVKLPFLGSTSFQIWKKLQKQLSDKLTSCNLGLNAVKAVQAINRFKSFFTLEDNSHPRVNLVLQLLSIL